MKSILFCFSFLVLSFFNLNAQLDANSVLKLHIVTEVEMNNIVSPNQGSLIYNSDDDGVYKFNGSNWFKIDNSLETIVLDSAAGEAIPTSDDVYFNFPLNTADIQSIDTGTFEVVDDLDQKGSASFSFVTIAIPSPTAMTQTAVMLYTPLGSLTSETFYSISENKTYSRKSVESTSDPVSPLIDFGYYYGATNKVK